MIRQLKDAIFLINPLLRVLKGKGGISTNKIEFKKEHDTCMVLGNGPSLKKDLPEILVKKEQADYICVNSFPLTDPFRELKPGVIVLTDTAWWRFDPSEEDEKTRSRVYRTLNDIDWDMQLIVSNNSDFDFIKSQIHNTRITPVKMRAVSIQRPLNRHAFSYYDCGYFMPPITNVLVAAVFCAIKAEYCNIEIYGADFSYMQLIDVDQETNHVVINEEHFYETRDREIVPKDAGENSPPITMYEFLTVQALALKSHELLAGYAKKKGIKIVNKSSYSLIDAYKRCSTFT